MRKVVIIGDSGHSKVMAEVIDSDGEGFVFAKLDDRYEDVFVDEGIVKGPIHHIHSLLEDDPELGVIIGIGSNHVRKKIVSFLAFPTEAFVTTIHNSAIVSPSVTIGSGTVIMPGAIINTDTVIGNHVIVNSGSVIEHDCVIGDFAHISPLAAITGGVQVGEGSHIGAGTAVIPGVHIGKWSTIGAGATVISNIGNEVTAVGNPARVIKREGWNDNEANITLPSPYERG